MLIRRSAQLLLRRLYLQRFQNACTQIDTQIDAYSFHSHLSLPHRHFAAADDSTNGDDFQDYRYENAETSGFSASSSSSPTRSSVRKRFVGPQMDVPRINLADPDLAKLDNVAIAKKVISSEVGNLNPEDVVFGLIPLLKNCCRIQSEASMEVAQSLLNRLLEEKKHINSTLLQELQNRAIGNISFGEDDLSSTSHEKEIEDEILFESLILSQLPFHMCMYGWAKMSQRGFYKVGPPKVREIIDLMASEDQYDKQTRESVRELQTNISSNDTLEMQSSCQPTTASYNTLITAYVNASAQDRKAGKAVDEILQQMVEAHATNGWHTKPNTRSFGLAIAAHGKSGRYKSPIFALKILEDMKEIHEAEKERYESETGMPYDVNDVEKNHWKIVTPDAIAYTGVIEAFARADGRGYAQRAEDVLFDMMDNKNRFGITPDSQVFTAAIRAWAGAAKRMGNPKARFEAAEKAESILQLMEAIATEESTDDKEGSTSTAGISPTTRTYNAVLAGWARSDVKEAAPRADALLQRMLANITPTNDEDHDEEDSSSSNVHVPAPDRHSFNITIGAYARSFDPGAAEKGEALFELMYELYHSGRLGEDIKPAADTYSSVINAWARSRGKPGQTANARRLLDTMLTKFRGGEVDLAPNVLSYTAVINAAVNEAYNNENEEDGWANDDNGDGVVETPFDDDSPYAIAVRTYHELKADTHGVGAEPDHLTYATMIKVLKSHTSAHSTERRSMLKTVFDDACASGRVSSAVIRELRSACPSVDLLERILRSRQWATSKESIYNDLPQKWKRNVGGDTRNHKVRIGDMKKKEAVLRS